MDWTAVRYKAKEIFRKYKYGLLVLALGMALMALSGGPKAPEDIPVADAGETPGSTSGALEEILAQIEGVGKVKVLLTESVGAETIYQTDEDSDTDTESRSIRKDTVIITDSDRRELGLVRQINPPRWQGAIVVCQGADRPAVQLSVVEAVANVTGISTDRITVLKMK